MSFAMDDIRLNNILQKLQTVFENKKTVSSESVNKKTDTEYDYTENVKISEDLSKRIKTVQSDLENSQQGLNILETADQGLSSINENLKKIKKNTQIIAEGGLTDKEIEDLNKEIKKDLENIDKISKETKFKDIKPLDGSSYKKVEVETSTEGSINISEGLKNSSVKSLDLPESKDLSIENQKDSEEFIKKIENAQKEINKRQEIFNDDKTRLQKTVSNLIVLDSGLSSAETAIKNSNDISSSIKEEAVKGILNNPTKTVTAQIKNLDKNIILALMSMHGLQH